MQAIIALSMSSAPTQALPNNQLPSPTESLGAQDIQTLIAQQQRAVFIDLYKKAIIEPTPLAGDVLALQKYMGFAGSDLDDKRGPITIGAAEIKAQELGITINTTNTTIDNTGYTAEDLRTPTTIHGVNANRLFYILMGVESGHKQFGGPLSVKSQNEPTTSYAGCVGIAQINPRYAQRFAEQFDMPWSKEKLLHDPEYNAEMGFNFLTYLLKKYKGNTRKAVAAYNAGETAVDRARGVPNNGETPRYVHKILSQYNTKGGSQWAAALPRILANPSVNTTVTFASLDVAQNTASSFEDTRRLPTMHDYGSVTASFRKAGITPTNTPPHNVFSLNLDGSQYAHALSAPVLTRRRTPA